MDRVHEAEDETRRLKRQLTISQNQLISLLGEQQKNDNSGRRANDHFDDDYDNGGGEEGNEIILFTTPSSTSNCQKLNTCYRHFFTIKMV